MNENKYPLISDSRDPRFLSIRALQTESGRSKLGLYLIEGIRHVARAVEETAPLQSLLIEPGTLSNPFGQKLARKLRRSIPQIRLTPRLYRELTLATEPQGIGAIVRQSWSRLPEIEPTRDSLWLAVESVDQAGNLGTMIRSAEASGVKGIFLLGQTADPYEPACVRASMGSIFSSKLVRCTTPEFADWVRMHKISVVGSSPSGLIDFKSLPNRWPVVLLVGSERHGLSEPLLELCDLTVRIPMHGRCDSINAAVAAGVLLFEIASRRKVHARNGRQNTTNLSGPPSDTLARIDTGRTTAQ